MKVTAFLFLDYFGVVASFTVDDFRAIGSVARFKFVGALIWAMWMLGGVLVNTI